MRRVLVRCGCGHGRKSQRELVCDEAIPFAVQMALHTGEAIERSRNYGTEVNRAARLMALAHGGQVLVSGTAEVLVHSQVTLRPLGDHLLRGPATPSTTPGRSRPTLSP